MRPTLAIAELFLMLVTSAPQDIRKGKAPDIMGPSVWGVIEVKGRGVTIDGHPRWSATGRIREDGKLQILWIENDTGLVAPGLYKIDGRAVGGRWGWSTSAEIDDNGDLVGVTMADTIRAYEAEKIGPPAKIKDQ